MCAYVKNLVEEHNMQRRGDEDPGMADVKLVATLTMQLAYRNKDKLSAGMIIGGWDRKLGAQVYGIPLGGSMQKVPFTVGGSGSAYIYGWCDNTWRENMSREDAEVRSRLRGAPRDRRMKKHRRAFSRVVAARA